MSSVTPRKMAVYDSGITLFFNIRLVMKGLVSEDCEKGHAKCFCVNEKFIIDTPIIKLEEVII